MCGICGFTGEPDPVALEKMTRAIVHRGPDEEGRHSDGRVNLGIRRLSIIDLDTGQQPIHNELGTVWTVCNGEIYNAPELRAGLERAGHRFYTHHADTEVICHLYEEYGDDFCHRINGMFAIALWDAPRGRLLLARDRMGVKPLFYAAGDGAIVFGSEIKALLAHPACSPRMDFGGLYHYFSFKNVPAPFTAFEGIRCLSPGELLVFEKGEARLRRWWKLRFREIEKPNERELQEKLALLLEDATRLRMQSDVPYGAYLSGGVDSSAVVGYMSRFSDAPIKTFALGYEDELENKEADLHFARRVSRRFGTEHHEYIMSCDELIEEVERVVEAFDQPFSGTISTYFLSKLISRHVKVALSGDGADELFGSYLSHRLAGPMHHYARFRRERPGGGLGPEERALLGSCTEGFLSDLHDRSGGREPDWRYHLYVFTDGEKRGLLSRRFLEECGACDTLGLVKREFESLTARGPLNRILEMEWNTQLPDQVLAFVDFLSMAHSVEIRSPFLDYRVVELAATMPDGLKIRDGVVKDILKRTVGPLLPEGIAQRPKEGFVLPIFDWMTDRLKPFCRSVLAPGRIRRHGLLRAPAARELLEMSAAGDRRAAARVWNLAMFQLWWERYFG